MQMPPSLPRKKGLGLGPNRAPLELAVVWVVMLSGRVVGALSFQNP